MCRSAPRRGNLDDIAELVVAASERAIEAEGDGLVGDQLQRFVIDFEGGAFFRAARHEADGGGIADADEISAGQTAAHQHAAAGGPDVGIVSRAGGDREIEIAILEDFGALAVPVSDDVGDALAQDFGDEEAAVK